MYNCIKTYNNERNKSIIESILCKFYSSRIGIRFLMQHHVSKKGLINDFNVYDLLRNCIKNVDYITERLYLELSDNIKIIGDSYHDLLFIPCYLEFIVIEVIKNSVSGALKNSKKIDITIEYIILDNNLSLKITDQSGGFDPSNIDRLYSFFYSNSKVSNKNLAGYGHGLGLSKLYIEYFWGYISINTLPGISTVCDIYIPSIIDNKENL